MTIYYFENEIYKSNIYKNVNSEKFGKGSGNVSYFPNKINFIIKKHFVNSHGEMHNGGGSMYGKGDGSGIEERNSYL